MADTETHEFTGSTRVRSGSYDPEKETIRVMFPDGRRWVYRGCKPSVWRDFKAASSPGRFIAAVLDAHSNGPS